MRRGIISVAIFVAFVAIFTISRHAITSTTTTTTTTQPPATTTSTTSTTLAATTCNATDFSGIYNEGEGAAGTIYASVTLTKTTGGTCTLYGWPLLTLSDRLGAVLKSTAIDVPSAGNDFQFSDRSREREADDLDAVGELDHDLLPRLLRRANG